MRSVRLVKTTGTRTSQIVVEWEGTTLVTRTDTKPAKTRTFHESELDHQAHAELLRQLRKGYVRLSAIHQVAMGEPVLEVGFERRADIFDISPAASSLVVAQFDGEDTYSLTSVAIATGVRETLYEGVGARTVHAVHVDRTGEAVWFQADQSVLRLELATRSVSMRSTHPSIGTVGNPGRFNEGRAHLQCNAARSRWLSCEDTRIVVRSDGGEVLWQHDLLAGDQSCNAALLSRGGDVVVLEVAARSRGTDIERQVWEVGTNTLLAATRGPSLSWIEIYRDQPLAALAATERMVPVLTDLAGGERSLAGDVLPYTAAYGGAVASTGQTLALALKWGAVVLDATTRARVVDVRYPQVQAVRYSDDGALLALAGTDGRLVVLRAS